MDVTEARCRSENKPPSRDRHHRLGHNSAPRAAARLPFVERARAGSWLRRARVLRRRGRGSTWTRALLLIQTSDGDTGKPGKVTVIGAEGFHALLQTDGC